MYGIRRGKAFKPICNDPHECEIDLPTTAQHSFINLFADDTPMYNGNEDMENLEVLWQNDIKIYLDGFMKTSWV